MNLPWRRRPEQDDDFVAFVASRRQQLRNTAYLLCGDWLAEDLVQTAFTKLYLAWPRVDRHEVLDQYVRRVLVRSYLDERRRPWRREHATEPDSRVLDAGAHHDPDPSDPRVLRNALAQLSERHRAVLVLRFWADQSVEQVAATLGCSAGTVKSQTSRGLAQLRAILGDDLIDATEVRQSCAM